MHFLLQDGKITGIGKAGNPDVMAGVMPVSVHKKVYSSFYLV